jgi:hypothetical protein
MSDNLAYLKMFARFPTALWRFVQHRLTLEEAERIIREQMEHREENFLRIAERCIYNHAASPYGPLLARARCELGDLRSLVRSRGLESALQELREAGVYVTYEEFKGRVPIRRGGLEFAVTARDFDNPSAHHDMMIQTGGSLGLANLVGQDLDYAAARAPHRMLSLAVHGALGAPAASWSYMVPGNMLRNLVQRRYFGLVTGRWFSPSGWRDSRYWLKYDLATLYTLAWMRALGVPAPFPEVVRLEQAAVIARWVGDTLRAHGRCLLFTGVSRALRVGLAAKEAGINLSGATFFVGGEPATPAKISPLEQAGVHCIINYSSTETSQIGIGCACPASIGDLHLFRDAVALITHPHGVEGTAMTVPAFNLTSLIASAPKIMLNFQIDDYGIVEARRCGCELEDYGYTTHLRDVRSYGKLVSEGVTLMVNEMVEVLEEVLPARFGGTPLDYQLLEEEAAQGFTRLCLVIHPNVEISDEQQVVEIVLRKLREASPMADAARVGWQGAKTIQVRRAEPVWTERGKFMPLHLQRHTNSS